MSLDFSVANVANHKKVTTSPHKCPYTGGAQWHPVTETLVWWSIPCGTPAITTRNFEEVWRRVKIWQEISPAPITGPDSVRLTLEDVAAHVGLSTNAALKTKTEFDKFVCETLFRRTMSQERSALEIVGVPDAE